LVTIFEVRLGIAEEEEEEEEEKEDDSSDDEEEIYTGRSTKRRRKTTTRMSSGIAAAAAGAEAIAPAMFKSTVEITQTLLACEDKNDKRHRDLLAVEERKLHIEEAKTEISQSWSGRPHHCRQQPCFRHPRTCW
jgi:hypothetical protein